MNKEYNFVGFSGSLRKASYSTALMRFFSQQLSGRGHLFRSIDIGAIPHYNEDVENLSLPESVKDARAIVGDCDGIVIATPEFNHGIPGVLKNALDWLSRPAFTSCFAYKPVIFCTFSPGALGGVRAQYQLRETFSSMLCEVIPMQEIVIPHVHQKFRDNVLTDAKTIEFVSYSLDIFIRGVANRKLASESLV
ncbi:NADPH-dependent FMN reductase [Paraburkholderia hospita]|uniref:NAD(P)H-dependent oxidoreductase n=1 Tax=Paraburkholderia hospita TaxID=169430 RepID=A0AAN1JLW6_9BURK|nr:NADPH-dependent FMN reductase [Paraburkholderia hospita]AUT76261.1 NAD(P)H-dependent oxidoreductase [Paraburkholderia hospita]SEI17772.1 chromate reductase [Paraburkholderia hospita]